MSQIADKIVMHRRFICVESAFGQQGHNKFWYVTVHSNGDLTTEWGRVGGPESTKTKSFGSADLAIAEAEKQIKKKTKGKKSKDGKPDSRYEEIDIVSTETGEKTFGGGNRTGLSGTSLEREAAQQIAKGDKKIEALVRYFAKKNIHNITKNTTLTYDKATGLFSTPLGVVGQQNILDAREILAELSDFVRDDRLEDDKAIPLLDKYLRLVPQSTGRNRPSLEFLIPSLSEVDKQSSVLDSLQASLDMVKNAPPDVKKKKDEPNIWNIHVSLCQDSKIVRKIHKLFNKTKQSVHTSSSLSVKNVYYVEHDAMNKAWSSRGAKLMNIWELWHGTRVGNILSILSNGLVIPPSSARHCTGRMYGDGLYFSDQSTKSLNYAQGFWGGGAYDNNCFMFLLDVAMGKYFIPRGFMGSKCPKGYDSTYAQARKSGVMNNEMIVYRTDQCNPRFLVEFSSR